MKPLTLPQTRTKHTELYKAVNEIISKLNGDKPGTIQEIPAKKLEWGAEAPKAMTWEEAQAWCNSQPGAYGEKNRWRLPTVVELLQAYWDKVEGFTQSSYYWSRTTYPANYSNAMFVDFYSGSSNNFGKTSSGYVRCVRELDD